MEMLRNAGFASNLTNFVFEPGKLTICLDSQAGSSGKGKIGAFITSHANNWQFACNAFFPQAGHWVRNDDGSEYFYQTLNSCAYQDTYEKMYIGPGGIIELPALWKELEQNKVKPERLGIDPMCGILQPKDAAFERGEVDLDGDPKKHSGTMSKGSTCHGVGACVARRRLRRPDMILARDVPELKPYLCDVSQEVMWRLDQGQSGLLELAQGFQLSYLLAQFYPACTSRNVTVAAGLDDMMLPPCYAGPVILNFRTYPIRISNYKYIAGKGAVMPDGVYVAPGTHLTWEMRQFYEDNDFEYETYKGDSGPGYSDQKETTWEQITADSHSPTPIMEITSVTKLPRRVFTFSRQNLRDAIRYNRTGHKMYASLNFANYVDAELAGTRFSVGKEFYGPMRDWLDCNWPRDTGLDLKFLGTGARTDDFVFIRG